jgi:hypothetical protein
MQMKCRYCSDKAKSEINLFENKGIMYTCLFS